MMSPLLRHRLRAAALAAAFYAGRAGFAGEGPDAGLTAAERTAVVETVTRSSSLGASLAGSRYRVFAVGTAVTKVAGGVRREAHTLLYDYTNDKTYHVVNDITLLVTVDVSARQVVEVREPKRPTSLAR